MKIEKVSQYIINQIFLFNIQKMLKIDHESQILITSEKQYCPKNILN
ncbi:unnamed protein product [Paramecium sonneborni]|uniref:Uncharacterized protein n=1 Tax=Paramecium sonneborni TaxID=65129 RepID=A0A8S1KGJ0_9CILI|nr:unnamed protein product [Paramecium sonneborni]